MEIVEVVKLIFQYGGTVIMAGLFVWLYYRYFVLVFLVVLYCLLAF